MSSDVLRTGKAAVLRATKLADAVVESYWFGDTDPERTALEASRSMAAAAAEAAGLKPFPAVASHVLRLANNPKATIDDLRHVVEGDPALAGQLLRVANSAAYRARHEIRDVGEAIMRLGAKQVGEIVVGVTTFGLFADVNGLGAAVRDHSAGVAALSRVLADEWYGGRINNVFLCGLMHDLGKLLAIQVGEVVYEHFDKSAVDTWDLAHIHERMLLGWDHAVLAAHVMEKWALPRDIVQVIAWHHQPAKAYGLGGDIAISVALLRIADRMEYQLRRSLEADEEFLRRMARDGALSYAGFSIDLVRALWPELAHAWKDAQSLFR